MIRTRELVKKYGSFTAVDGVNLNIPSGEIYGFLGPNGSGKTSTIMMLLGIVPPTRGEIFLFDERYADMVTFAVQAGYAINLWQKLTGDIGGDTASERDASDLKLNHVAVDLSVGYLF